MNQNTKPKSGGLVLAGIVVAAKTPKTVTVEVTRLVRYPKYGKYLRRTKRYLVHDETSHRVGEQVRIKEIRPLSRRKHFIVL